MERVAFGHDRLSRPDQQAARPGRHPGLRGPRCRPGAPGRPRGVRAGVARWAVERGDHGPGASRVSHWPPSAAWPGATRVRSATTTSCSCTSHARSPGPSWTPSRGGCGTRCGTPVPRSTTRCAPSPSAGRSLPTTCQRRSGLLDIAHLGGDAEIVSAVRSTVAHDWRANARRRLPQLVDAVQARHTRMGDAAHLLEPDLKEARGGLRDMTVLRALTAAWLADRPAWRRRRRLRAAARRTRRPARRHWTQP